MCLVVYAQKPYISNYVVGYKVFEVKERYNVEERKMDNCLVTPYREIPVWPDKDGRYIMEAAFPCKYPFEGIGGEFHINGEGVHFYNSPATAMDGIRSICMPGTTYCIVKCYVPEGVEYWSGPAAKAARMIVLVPEVSIEIKIQPLNEILK